MPILAQDRFLVIDTSPFQEKKRKFVLFLALVCCGMGKVLKPGRVLTTRIHVWYMRGQARFA